MPLAATAERQALDESQLIGTSAQPKTSDAAPAMIIPVSPPTGG